MTHTQAANFTGIASRNHYGQMMFYVAGFDYAILQSGNTMATRLFSVCRWQDWAALTGPLVDDVSEWMNLWQRAYERRREQPGFKWADVLNPISLKSLRQLENHSNGPRT